MNLKVPLRLVRLLVVLALIVALLGSSIPVPARAVGLGTVYNITARLGMEIASRAIGVGPGNSPDVFNNLITRMADAFEPVSNGFCQLLITGSSGNFRSFLSADFLSWVLNWFFDSDTLRSGFQAPSDLVGSDILSRALAKCNDYYICVAWVRDDGALQFVGTTATTGFSIRPIDGGGYSIRQANGFSYTRWEINSETTNISGTTTSYSMTIPGSYQVFQGGTWQSVYSDLDLSLDSVGDSLDAAPYTDWVGQSVSNDDQAFVPVSVPSLDSSTISAQTQTQAQAGTVPDAVVDEIIAGEDVVPDTGTIADVITAVRALVADIVAAVQAIPAAIADIFSPAADPEVYQVDLKDFFPFCIPFDLFDIVTAFAAEPEAPVFEWPISVPRWGFEYTLKVDLQEWEDIASLFRTLELTIFCVGLAIVTREKILRS